MLQRKIISYIQLMRLNRPIGIFLLLWPTLWALWLAAKGVPPYSILIIFVTGTILMRSAGCIINDFADRNFDRHVKRTKDRPLIVGKVSSQEALILFSLLVLCAFVLVLFLNLTTVILGFIGLLLTMIYPFMKRFTHWPQFFLGMAFAWGVPMAFSAVEHHISLEAWLIFLGALLWPVIYDTMYAMVDREDDIKIGVKSTAVLFGRYDRLIIALLQTLFLMILLLLGELDQLSLWYYLSLLLVAFLMGYQQMLLRNRIPANCFKAFLNNNWLGLIIFLGICCSF